MFNFPRYKTIKCAILSIIFIVLIANNLFSQNAYGIVDTVSTRARINDLKTQIISNDYSSRQIYEIAAAYASIEELDSALKYLRMEISEKSILLETLVDWRFEKLRKLDEWTRLVIKFQEEWLTSYPYGNLPYALALMEMIEIDQMNRDFIEFEISNYGYGSSEVRERVEIINTIDSLNIRKLDSLIHLYGWPLKRMVGEEPLNSAFILLLHADLDTQLKYINHIETSCLNGEISLGSFCYLQDKILIGQKKKQLYGTQFFRNTFNDDLEIYPIEDELNVDKRRIEMGLDSLHRYISQLENIYKN